MHKKQKKCVYSTALGKEVNPEKTIKREMQEEICQSSNKEYLDKNTQENENENQDYLDENTREQIVK